MRVQFLRRVVIFAAFIASTLLCCLVQSAPAPAPQPMMPSDLDNLRRSIAVLREAVGNSIADATLHLPSAQHKLHRDTLYGWQRGESSEAAILNIKADIRTMDEAEMERIEEEVDSEERLMQADRVSAHRARHFRHRKRRKGCGSSRHGHKQMLCPSRSSHHYDVCITAEQLCDDIADCPGGEDENPTNCLFYKSTKEQLKHIYNTVLLLADHAAGQGSHHEL